MRLLPRNAVCCLSGDVLKAQMRVGGRLVGTVWRKGWEVRLRGRLPERPYVARIFRTDGSVEDVVQREKPGR